MTCYTAYGLVIQSAFDFPEMVEVDDPPSAPDVSISAGSVAPVSDSVEAVGIERIEAEPDVCRLSYDSFGTFLVECGRRVLFDADSPGVVEQKKFRQLVENQVMAVLLLQRGLLVLHASAVSVDGRGVVFLGDRGAGKSTTAAAFHAAGYPILEDDVVAIRFDDDGPVLLPGIPQVRLQPDAVEAFDLTERVETETDAWTDKRYHTLAEVPDPAPAVGCYVLEDGVELSFESRHGYDRLRELLTSTYARGLLDDTGTTADHFRQCTTLLEAADLRVLRRPRDHTELPLLVRAVVEDINSNVHEGE